MQFLMNRTYMLRALSFVLLYVVFTKAALLLALDGGFATVVWPGSGLALSILLIYGNNMWPAIAMGAFLVNFLQGDSIGVASLISIGNTLEALIAFNIIKTYGDLSLVFVKLKNVINFVLASLTGSLISAAVGTTTVLLFCNSDIIYVETFTTWWLGDVTSCLMIVPMVMLMNKANLLFLENRRTGVSFLFLTVASSMVFLKKYDDDVIPKVLIYSMIIFPLSAALGQNRLSAMLHVFVISVFAICGTINGKGPFIYSELNDSLIILQSFTVILLIITLIVSVGIKEKEIIEDKLSNLLTEKEVLISEIHHRVKNNLAVVSSLLFLERENMHSEEIRHKMDQTQLRIKTIALVHDKLNLKSNIKTV